MEAELISVILSAAVTMKTDKKAGDTVRTSLEELMPLIRTQLKAGQSVRFFPKGTSMLPMLRETLDSVTISAAKDGLRKYDIALYKRDDGQYVLHRVIRAGETYTFIGDSQFEEEQCVRADQVIAVVTGFCRKEREYSVSDLSYQLYVRLWHLSRPMRRFWRRGCRWLRRHMIKK